MADIDDTDRTILRLLVEDGRRPYSDIAEEVGLSPPAVSDRIQRLRDFGIIRRITADLDRSRLRDGVAVLVELDVTQNAVEATRASLTGAEPVEHVFTTAEGRLVFTVRAPDGDVRGFLEDTVPFDAVGDIDVRLLTSQSWSPGVGAAEFAPSCAECDNTVTSEGVTETLGGETYHFCCSSCADRFESRYESLEQGA
ncbi:AsnC family transcriptional regulator [Halomarina ordinaria]|uniref:AsnC family transcriptional regulator n=1 Tax=Halomarina ordinaria TaxID=3033939 RepID=A0ABD5U4W8_9EURY|nr:AsnC family transcriptional regulator [Halomarina sp. PSRA2]